MSVRAHVSNITRRSFHLAYWRDLSHYKRALFHDGPPLVVFQMGKVGSTSIYESLKDLSPPYSLYHAHTLGDHMSREGARHYRVRRFVPRHALASGILRRELAAGQPRGRWKVISVVRDPIAMNISSFFQVVDWAHPEFDFRGKLVSLDTKELARQLVDLFLSSHSHDHPLDWCDAELGGALGVDVYAQPFPYEQGWKVYEFPSAEVLLLRFEDLSLSLEEALPKFLDGFSPALPKANASDSKEYADVYREFKSLLRLPSSYVERMYESRYARQFYSPSELKDFARAWSS